MKQPGTLGHASRHLGPEDQMEAFRKLVISIKGSVANGLPGGQMKVLVDSLQPQGL